MAASNWKMYDKSKEYIGDGTMDLDADSFKAALFTSASNAETLTISVFASLTNEITGIGYTAGGQALAGVTWVESSGTVTFDSNNVVWTAGAGGITARFGVIYDDTPTAPADPLVCHCILDATPADVTATDGNTLTISMNASGIFAMSGGAA